MIKYKVFKEEELLIIDLSEIVKNDELIDVCNEIGTTNKDFKNNFNVLIDFTGLNAPFANNSKDVWGIGNTLKQYNLRGSCMMLISDHIKGRVMGDIYAKIFKNNHSRIVIAYSLYQVEQIIGFDVKPLLEKVKKSE